MLKGEGTSGTSHCYSSNTGCSKAEHETGGQGHPVKLAAGVATCSHPPTASDQVADTAPAWRSALHGSWAVQWKRASALALSRHPAYPANAQARLHHPFLKTCNTGWNGNLFDLSLWFSAVPTEKCRKRFYMHLTSYSFCAQRFCQGVFGNFDNLFGVLRWPSGLLNKRPRITAGHTTYIISVPGIVLKYLEILVPEP